MRKAVAAALLLLFAWACTPKPVPLPVVTTPRFPEFVEPTVPAAEAESPVGVSQSRAWQFLQAGDLKNADRELTVALKASPGFYPAETARGYLDLARKDPASAVSHFDKALEKRSAYAPALVGKGQALVLLNRETDALAAFEAAVAADATLTQIARRIEVLRFRSAQHGLAEARDLARAGKLDDAARQYAAAIAASPDSPFLYRELAAVERRKGDTDAALEHFRKAAALDASDADSRVQIGELLEARDDLEGAARSYGDALAIEPDPAAEKHLEAVRDRVALSRLPGEYRAIEQAPQVTRGDLAALVGIRLAGVLQRPPQREAVLITDVRTHWAASWIMAVARAGIMEPYANHAFQPRTLVRRSDLAQVVARLLGRITAANPGRAHGWEAAHLKFADIAPGHVAYPAASIAVAAGILTVNGDNAFQPSRPVTGQEAVEAIDRLSALAAGVARGAGAR